jgi:hypothetical protein
VPVHGYDCWEPGPDYATGMRLKAIAVALAGLAALPALAGCGGSGSPNASTSNSSMRTRKGIGAPGAKVSFVTPREASTLGPTVVVRVKLKHFTLAPKQVGKAAKQGEGHLHFSLDQGKFDHPKYSGANGRTAVKLGVEGQYSPSTTPSIVYKQIPPGTHELEVYLANNDHTSTGVGRFVSFMVKAGGAAGPPAPTGGGSGSGY